MNQKRDSLKESHEYEIDLRSVVRQMITLITLRAQEFRLKSGPNQQVGYAC